MWSEKDNKNNADRMIPRVRTFQYCFGFQHKLTQSHKNKSTVPEDHLGNHAPK